MANDPKGKADHDPKGQIFPPEGQAVPTGPGIFIDEILFDFAVDQAILLERHIEFLNKVVQFIEAPGHGPVTVSIDGFASHTGSRLHNLALSERRERAVVDFLKSHTTLFADPLGPNKINTDFHGFANFPADAERAKFRMVRVVVHSPGVVPPPEPEPPPIPDPKPDPTPEKGSTEFQIRLLFLFSGSPLPFLQKDKGDFEIVDIKKKRSATYIYDGESIVPPLLELPSFSITAPGPFTPFHTAEPAELTDFLGKGEFKGGAGLGPLSAKSTLTIKTFKGVIISPTPIPIDTGRSFPGVSAGSKTRGFFFFKTEGPFND